MKFPVMPICERQLRDVEPADIIQNGLYRKCNLYKGGGGYDKFPAICKERLGIEADTQFIVQLRGCPLNCPYCYVTRDGIDGEPVHITADELVREFINTEIKIFHLMGGAPALYIRHWPEIINKLPNYAVFHSDLLCVEGTYGTETLTQINQPNCLYAVGIKGLEKKFTENTSREFPEALFWENLGKLITANVNFYFTYTNMTQEEVAEFKGECRNRLPGHQESIFNGSFSISLIHYKALDQKDKSAGRMTTGEIIDKIKAEIRQRC